MRHAARFMISQSDRFVATFVGSPPMNILPCQIRGEGDFIQVIPLADRCRPSLDSRG